MNENTMKTELDAAEGVKAVEETKEQIKEETAPKLQPKPVPNQEQLTETTNAEIVQDQKVKEEATNIFGVSDTELLTEEQKYLDGLQKGLDKEIQEYKAKEGDNFDKAEFQKFLDGKHKTITTKIRNGIVNGNIENINNIYKLGDDIVDYLLGDIYDSSRPVDFELIPLSKPVSERSKFSQIIGGFEETEADRNDTVYGISKGLAQYILPAFKTNGLLKNVGVKKFRGGLTGVGVGAVAVDPYEDKLLGWLSERSDIAPLIRDVLGNATEADEDGNLKPAEERLKARLYSVANDFITGEILLPVSMRATGAGVKEINKLAKKTGIDKATAKVIFGIRDITKDSAGKVGNEMVDFFMNQVYNLRNKGGEELNRLKANLKAIIHRSGTDIEEQVYDSQQQNLMENLNLYMKNIKEHPLLQKYYMGGDGESLSAVPLRGKKITRTMNARDLSRYFKGKNGKDFADKEAIVDFIMARGAALKASVKPNSRTWKAMQAKARTQLPLDTINVLTDFIDQYGKGGDFDLEASIIAMNDIVNETAIVLQDLTSKMDDQLRLKRAGKMDTVFYDRLKKDFAFSLKFFDSVLSIKRQTIAPVSRALSVSNVTSGKITKKGLSNLKNLREDEIIAENIQRKARIKNAEDMVNPSDPLGEFDIEDIIKMADSGDTKALQQTIRRLNMAATNPKALKAIMAAQKGNGVIKISNHLFINSILSSPITHQVNILSTGINTFMRPTAKFVGAERKEERIRALKEIQYLMSTSFESMKMGVVAFRANRNIVDASASLLDGQSAQQLMMEGWSGTRGALGRAFMNGYGIPSRFLMAEDEVFKQLNFRAFVRAEIWERTHRAMERGTRKFATRADYNKYVNNQFNSIMDVINRESVEGKLSKRNLELLDRARKYAAEATFTEDLKEGSFSEAFTNLVNEYPLARQIVPFIRTPINITKQAFNASPLALLVEMQDTRVGKLTGMSWASKNVLRKASWLDQHYADLTSKDKGVRALARGRTRIGSSVFAGSIYLAHQANNPEAAVAITGGLPKSLAKREILINQGFQPYSIRLLATEEDVKKYGRKGEAYEVIMGENDQVKYVRGADGKIKYKYWSYKRLEPYASFLSVAADFTRITGYMGEEQILQKEAIQQVVQAAVYDSTIDKTFLDGIAELFQLVERPYQLNAFLARRVAQTAIPFSGALKFVKNAKNSYGEYGDIAMNKRVAKGQYEGDINPLIFAQRVLNEAAGTTPFGDANAIPYQNHITGKYTIKPTGFGKDEMNIFFDGHATETVSVNDPVMTVLMETGREFARPDMTIYPKSSTNPKALFTDETEYKDLIYSTVTYTKGSLQKTMYQTMEDWINNNQEVINRMRMKPDDLRWDNLSPKLRKKYARLFQVTDLSKDDFDKATRVELIYMAREEVGDAMAEIHEEYKRDAKKFWIENNFRKMSPEKYNDFNNRRRKNSKLYDTLVSDSRIDILEDFASLNLLG